MERSGLVEIRRHLHGMACEMEERAEDETNPEAGRLTIRRWARRLRLEIESIQFEIAQPEGSFDPSESEARSRSAGRLAKSALASLLLFVPFAADADDAFANTKAAYVYFTGEDADEQKAAASRSAYIDQFQTALGEMISVSSWRIERLPRDRGVKFHIACWHKGKSRALTVLVEWVSETREHSMVSVIEGASERRIEGQFDDTPEAAAVVVAKLIEDE